MGLKSEIAIVTTVRESGSESYREFATSRLGPGSRLAVAARVKFRPAFRQGVSGFAATSA